MHVLVTGASGDFGSCIVPEILARGHRVTGLSRRLHSQPSADYRHVSADIRDADALTAAMDGIDAVVHLAWTTHPLHDAETTRAVDVGGTQAVLTAMERGGVSRLVTASSVMAYGANADNPSFLREGDTLRPSPKQLYSKRKAEAEALIVASPVNAVMARATNIMGRTTTGVTQEGFAAPAILAMKGGRNLFQFVHPDDLSRFFADALDHPEWSGPVNLAAPDTITMREVAEILHKRYMEVSPKYADAILGFLWDRGWFSLGPGAVEAFLNFRLSRRRGSPRSSVSTVRGRLAIAWRTSGGPIADMCSWVLGRSSFRGDGPGRRRRSSPIPRGRRPSRRRLATRRRTSACAAEEQTSAFGHGIYGSLSVIFVMGATLPGKAFVPRRGKACFSAAAPTTRFRSSMPPGHGG